MFSNLRVENKKIKADIDISKLSRKSNQKVYRLENNEIKEDGYWTLELLPTSNGYDVSVQGEYMGDISRSKLGDTLKQIFLINF